MCASAMDVLPESGVGGKGVPVGALLPQTHPGSLFSCRLVSKGHEDPWPRSPLAEKSSGLDITRIYLSVD